MPPATRRSITDSVRREGCKRVSAPQRAHRHAVGGQTVTAAASPAERESGHWVPSVEVEPSASSPADIGDTVEYSYHSDGHYKATIEDVFKKSSSASFADDHAPWKMGWQTNERNILWNEDLKIRLMKKIVAQKTHLSEAELESCLQTLVSLLPDIPARLPTMKPEIVARLLSDRQAVAQRLVSLKQIFPGADCGKMLVKELGLMSESLESLQQRAEELRKFLPTVDVDRLVQENPSVLSVDSFKAAVEDARRLMPGLNIESMMVSDPDFVLSLQKGTDMIPYDAIPDNPWGHK